MSYNIKTKQSKIDINYESERFLQPEPTEGTLTYEDGMVSLELDSYWIGALQIKCTSNNLSVQTPLKNWVVKYNSKGIVLFTVSPEPVDKIVLVYTGRLNIISADICGWKGTELVSLSVEGFDKELIRNKTQPIDKLLDRGFDAMKDNEYIGGARPDKIREKDRGKLRKLKQEAFRINSYSAVTPKSALKVRTFAKSLETRSDIQGEDVLSGSEGRGGR